MNWLQSTVRKNIPLKLIFGTHTYRVKDPLFIVFLSFGQCIDILLFHATTFVAMVEYSRMTWETVAYNDYSVSLSIRVTMTKPRNCSDWTDDNREMGTLTPQVIFYRNAWIQHLSKENDKFFGIFWKFKFRVNFMNSQK